MALRSFEMKEHLSSHAQSFYGSNLHYQVWDSYSLILPFLEHGAGQRMPDCTPEILSHPATNNVSALIISRTMTATCVLDQNRE